MFTKIKQESRYFKKKIVKSRTRFTSLRFTYLKPVNVSQLPLGYQLPLEEEDWTGWKLSSSPSSRFKHDACRFILP